MSLEDLALLSRRGRIRLAALVVAFVAASVWASAVFLKPAPPRSIVVASGPTDGLFHKQARLYVDILARSGITVEERLTKGAGENMRLLQDPASGVDIAFTQGGIAHAEQSDDVVMLASLYYKPMWVFYRGAEALVYLNQLRNRRVSVGEDGGGTHTFVLPVFALNDLTGEHVATVPLSNSDAIRALQAGEIDAAVIVDGADNEAVAAALRDPGLKLLNFGHADAYHRRVPYIVKLTLPSGVVDLGKNIPENDVALIGTKAMLAARDDLHPAIVNLLIDAAREVHGRQGFFEEAGEFPGTGQVDLRVSADAERHKRFGPTFLYHYLPFWLATLVERAIVILLPIVAVLFPLFSYLPQFLRWRNRSRVYRWYGELALLERDVATRQGPAPVEKWLADLDRIGRAVSQIHTPSEFASEAYTLRQHVDYVRHAILARTEGRPLPVAV